MGLANPPAQRVTQVNEALQSARHEVDELHKVSEELSQRLSTVTMIRDATLPKNGVGPEPTPVVSLAEEIQNIRNGVAAANTKLRILISSLEL